MPDYNWQYQGTEVINKDQRAYRFVCQQTGAVLLQPTMQMPPATRNELGLPNMADLLPPPGQNIDQPSTFDGSMGEKQRLAAEQAHALQHAAPADQTQGQWSGIANTGQAQDAGLMPGPQTQGELQQPEHLQAQAQQVAPSRPRPWGEEQQEAQDAGQGHSMGERLSDTIRDRLEGLPRPAAPPTTVLSGGPYPPPGQQPSEDERIQENTQEELNQDAATGHAKPLEAGAVSSGDRSGTLGMSPQDKPDTQAAAAEEEDTDATDYPAD